MVFPHGNGEKKKWSSNSRNLSKRWGVWPLKNEGVGRGWDFLLRFPWHHQQREKQNFFNVNTARGFNNSARFLQKGWKYLVDLIWSQDFCSRKGS